MRIGELSRRTGVSERSLRYYEEKGLVDADRTPGGQREYAAAMVDRVVLVQNLLAAGLGTSSIAEVLPCMRDYDGGPGEAATPWLLEHLCSQRDLLDAQIAQLELTRQVLDEVITTASSG